MEIGKDNCINTNTPIPSTKRLEMSKKEDYPFNVKEAELRPSRGGGSLVWTPESTPERRNQESMMSRMGILYPPSILTRTPSGDVSPLLSQSSLCVRSPSPRPETAESSEIISNAHDEIYTSLVDLPMGLPINENGAEGLTPLLPMLDATPSCEGDTESVEAGWY